MWAPGGASMDVLITQGTLEEASPFRAPWPSSDSGSQ